MVPIKNAHLSKNVVRSNIIVYYTDLPMRDTECAKNPLFFSDIIMRSICAYSVVNLAPMPLVRLPHLKTVRNLYIKLASEFLVLKKHSIHDEALHDDAHNKLL